MRLSTVCLNFPQWFRHSLSGVQKLSTVCKGWLPKIAIGFSAADLLFDAARQACYDARGFPSFRRPVNLMPVNKRYPNRKLYDTAAKSYVTLDQITQMIREGQEVQVLDHETGEDLTNLTLTQIILEQEKKSASGFLPRSLLTGLIRTGGDTLGHVRRSLPNWPPQLEGGLEEQAAAVLEQGRQVVESFHELFRLDARVNDLLHLLNLPTQRELQQLQSRIEALNDRLEALLAERRDRNDAPDHSPEHSSNQPSQE